MHQRVLLRERALEGDESAERRIDRVRLRALEYIRSQPKVGRIWLAECDCGGTREVSATDFTSTRISRCQLCVDPDKAASQVMLNARREQLRNQFYPKAFRDSWRSKVEEFTPMQRLLFEAILYRRRRPCGAMEMQAADWVLRTPESEIDLEIGSFGSKRIESAIRATREAGYELPEGRSPKSFLFD